MRKIVMVILIAVGMLFTVIALESSVSLVHISSAVPFVTIPPGLHEDLKYVLTNEAESDLRISLSHEEFFYNETIHVSITANNPDAEIYYTTDGSNPVYYGKQYVGHLVFPAEEYVQGTVLKAVAITENDCSDVLTHSYFVGQKADERFDCYVFSISTDDYNLYDYDYGILIPGRMYDDYMASTEDPINPEFRRPANYNMRGWDSERPVYVEAFTKEGERVVTQNAGIRVYGGATRRRNPKSLRLIARRLYEPSLGMFNHAFYENHISAGSYGSPITAYDTLVLRTSANDLARAQIRDRLALQIAYEAGYSVVSPQEDAAVFINGSYYSYAHINIRTNEQYLEDLYDTPERAFDICDGGIQYITTDNHDIEREFTLLLEYAKNGIDESTLSIIEDFFDIDNLLFYYAIQTYTGNSDWPGSNSKIWRYSGTKGTDTMNKELDGRWRFILYDLDHTLNFEIESAPSVKSISRVLEGNRSPVFRELVKHPIYTGMFANYICDLASEHFQMDNVKRVIEQINNAGIKELIKSNEIWERDIDYVMENRALLLEYIEQRPEYIMVELQELFGFTDMYKVISDGSCKINTLNGNEGTYFIENSVTLTPKLEKWQKVDYWLVNGEVRHAQDELTVSVNDADGTGTVSVRLITREELPPLAFCDTFDTGDICGFTMRNLTDIVQSTNNLYLSDNINNLKKWPFPAMNIRPGSTLEFAGRNSTSADSLLKMALNFNPRSGEMIFLSDENNDILDYIVMD